MAAAAEAGRGDTFEDTGEVDMSRSGRRVWLVKMPQFILDAWKQAGPDAELGRVRVTQKGHSTEVSAAPVAAWLRGPLTPRSAR